MKYYVQQACEEIHRKEWIETVSRLKGCYVESQLNKRGAFLNVAKGLVKRVVTNLLMTQLQPTEQPSISQFYNEYDINRHYENGRDDDLSICSPSAKHHNSGRSQEAAASAFSALFCAVAK